MPEIVKSENMKALISVKNERDLIEAIADKKVLFIATKNKDYLRITQEIDIVKENAESYTIIAYPDKKYIVRILKVFFNIIFCSSKQYDVVFIGFMAQMILPFLLFKFHPNFLIIDFFISIFDTLVDDRKKFKENSLPAHIFKWIDKKTISYADLVISDTIEHGKYFIQDLDAEDSKVVPLYLKADVNMYYPHEVVIPTQFENKLIVLFFGSILPVQGVEVILECIRKMRNESDIHFIMIGPINNKLEKVQSTNVTYIDWASQQELSDYIAGADLCLGGHFSSTVSKARRTIPGKVYIYKAMDKKVILGDSPANRELFLPDEKNIYVPLGDPDYLMSVIIEEREKEIYAKRTTVS